MNVSLSEFINGQKDDPLNLRLGTRIFAACDYSSCHPLGASDVARTARKLIDGVSKVEYNLFANNCHLFTASCILGEMSRKLSFADWLRDGSFSIERLGAIISEILNDARPIAWLGVWGPSSRFRYELTDVKLAVLRDEKIMRNTLLEKT